MVAAVEVVERTSLGAVDDDGRPTRLGDTPGEQEFEGFMAGGPTLRIPAQFFVELLPLIGDATELRVTLYALYEMGRQAWARPVRGSLLETSEALVRSLIASGDLRSDATAAETRRVISASLSRSVERGVFVAYALEDGDKAYLANNEAGRRAMQHLHSGALTVDGWRVAHASHVREVPRPVEVYEQEIGLLTPTTSESLAKACERYPEEWVTDALRLAARNNARSWAYAEAILRRWEHEGKDDGSRGRRDASDRGSDGRAERNHGPYEHLIVRSEADYQRIHGARERSRQAERHGSDDKD